MTSLSIFGFLANLERSGGWIPETESAKFMFSLTVDFCVAKNENMPFTLLLGVKVLFWTKNAIFLRKKMLASAKLREPRYKKLYFLKLHIDVYLPAKFEVSSIILTSFRQGGGNSPHTPQNKPLKSPPRLGSARALSVTMVTIVADKGSFSSDQAYIKKW